MPELIEKIWQNRNSSASYGSWRMVVNDNDDVVFQRYEGRTWTTKKTISG